MLKIQSLFGGWYQLVSHLSQKAKGVEVLLSRINALKPSGKRLYDRPSADNTDIRDHNMSDHHLLQISKVWMLTTFVAKSSIFDCHHQNFEQWMLSNTCIYLPNGMEHKYVQWVANLHKKSKAPHWFVSGALYSLIHWRSQYLSKIINSFIIGIFWWHRDFRRTRAIYYDSPCHGRVQSPKIIEQLFSNVRIFR